VHDSRSAGAGLGTPDLVDSLWIFL